MIDETVAGSRAATCARVLDVLRQTLDGQAPEEPIDEGTGLLGHGIGLDSIDVLTLVAALEEAFDLTIEDRELRIDHFRTVGALVSFVHGRLPHA